MKHNIALLLLALVAVTVFSTSAALAQTENTAEATFYVH